MKKLLLLIALIPSAANAEQGEADYSAILGDMSARLTALEEENRNLYGKIEELEYNYDKLSKNSDSMTVKQNYYVTKPGDVASAYVVKATPIQQDENEYVTKAAPFKKAADSQEEAQFNAAFANLGKQDYAAAKTSFSDFIKNNPDSEFIAQAHFWLGEIAVKQESAAEGAVNYLKSYKLAPTGKRAAESLLKLSQNLNALGKTDEACKNLERFNSEFPEAHFDLKEKAKNELAKLSCK